MYQSRLFFASNFNVAQIKSSAGKKVPFADVISIGQTLQCQKHRHWAPAFLSKFSFCWNIPCDPIVKPNFFSASELHFKSYVSVFNSNQSHSLCSYPVRQGFKLFPVVMLESTFKFHFDLPATNVFSEAMICEVTSWYGLPCHGRVALHFPAQQSTLILFQAQ